MKFENLLEKAYTPYSGKPNACIVIDTQGGIHPGVIVENLSYPLSISHIQAALFGCLSTGNTPDIIIYNAPPSHGDLFEYWEKEYNLKSKVDPDFEFELSQSIRKLTIDEVPPALTKLCELCVIPNSAFPVSCLLETDTGFIEGVNVECSNWELGLCAERVAVSRAVSYGLRDFKSIHIMAPKSDYVSPCGGCRQVLMEHLPGVRVFLYQNESESMTLTTSQLLPYHFKGDSLKK